MKKILLLGICLTVLVACKKEKNKLGNLHLTGNIKELNQGKIYIQKIEDSTLVILDSIIFNGKSTFETYLDIDKPEVLYLFLDRGQTNSIDNSIAFFAEPGEMTFTSKLKEFYRAAKITGSKNQDLWVEFNEINTKFTNQNLDIMQARLNNEMMSKFNQKTKDSIDKAFNTLITRKYRFVAQFASTHADYEIAPYLAVTEIADINTSFLDTIAKKMSPEVANSKYGKMLSNLIKKRKASEKQ